MVIGIDLEDNDVVSAPVFIVIFLDIEQRRALFLGRIAQEGNNISQFANLGSFAEHMLVHEHSLVKIRDDMPLDRAALIGCGVITGFGAAVNTAMRVNPTHTGMSLTPRMP